MLWATIASAAAAIASAAALWLPYGSKVIRALSTWHKLAPVLAVALVIVVVSHFKRNHHMPQPDRALYRA